MLFFPIAAEIVDQADPEGCEAGQGVSQPKAHILHSASLQKFLPKLKQGGRLFLNSSIVADEIPRQDVKVVKAPVTELALELGSAKVLNIIMLGVYVGCTEVIAPQIVWETVAHKLTGKAALLPLNERAFQMGLELGKAQR